MEANEYNKLSEMYARKINECVDLKSENISLREQLEKERERSYVRYENIESLRSSLSEKEKEIQELNEEIETLRKFDER